MLASRSFATLPIHGGDVGPLQGSPLSSWFPVHPFLNKNLKYTWVEKDKVEQRFLSQETVTS